MVPSEGQSDEIVLALWLVRTTDGLSLLDEAIYNGDYRSAMSFAQHGAPMNIPIRQFLLQHDIANIGDAVSSPTTRSNQ